MFAVLASCNGADGISDIEGKVTRVGASECGQRASFNRDRDLADEPHWLAFGCRNACGVVDRIGIINYHDVRNGGKLGSSRRGDLVKPVLSGSKKLVVETTFLFKSRSDFAAS